MKLSEFKAEIGKRDSLTFLTPGGEAVPRHFHVTEVGLVRKRYIDCGGTSRDETRVSFQLWYADDFEHRLQPGKLISIIELAEEGLGIDPELEVEVEFQGDTIGRYGLESNGTDFGLTALRTDCLAREKCGITPSFEAPFPSVPSFTSFDTEEKGGCAPGGGCC